jgi:hypothetical protein
MPYVFPYETLFVYAVAAVVVVVLAVRTVVARRRRERDAGERDGTRGTSRERPSN